MIDSSGLKGSGEGAGKVRQHGVSKRRTWRKLHVAVDAATPHIIAAALTAAGVGGAPVLPDVLTPLEPEEPLASVAADGLYDTQACHEAILRRGAQARIPPRDEAVEWADLAAGRVHPRTAIRHYPV